MGPWLPVACWGSTLRRLAATEGDGGDEPPPAVRALARSLAPTHVYTVGSWHCAGSYQDTAPQPALPAEYTDVADQYLQPWDELAPRTTVPVGVPSTPALAAPAPSEDPDISAKRGGLPLGHDPRDSWSVRLVRFRRGTPITTAHLHLIHHIQNILPPHLQLPEELVEIIFWYVKQSGEDKQSVGVHVRMHRTCR